MCLSGASDLFLVPRVAGYEETHDCVASPPATGSRANRNDFATARAHRSGWECHDARCIDTRSNLTNPLQQTNELSRMVVGVD